MVVSGYPPDHINAVLTHTIHFLSLLAFYLGIKLPFDVVWSRSSTPPPSIYSFNAHSNSGVAEDARASGLLGVGTPWIGAIRGNEYGGWARYVTCVLFCWILIHRLLLDGQRNIHCMCLPRHPLHQHLLQLHLHRQHLHNLEHQHQRIPQFPKNQLRDAHQLSTFSLLIFPDSAWVRVQVPRGYERRVHQYRHPLRRPSKCRAHPSWPNRLTRSTLPPANPIPFLQERPQILPAARMRLLRTALSRQH